VLATVSESARRLSPLSLRSERVAPTADESSAPRLLPNGSLCTRPGEKEGGDLAKTLRTSSRGRVFAGRARHAH